MGKRIDWVNGEGVALGLHHLQNMPPTMPPGVEPMDLVVGTKGTLVKEGHISKIIIEAIERRKK